jgi:hypothetical protein
MSNIRDHHKKKKHLLALTAYVAPEMLSKLGRLKVPRLTSNAASAAFQVAVGHYTCPPGSLGKAPKTGEYFGLSPSMSKHHLDAIGRAIVGPSSSLYGVVFAGTATSSNLAPTVLAPAHATIPSPRPSCRYQSRVPSGLMP